MPCSSPQKQDVTLRNLKLRYIEYNEIWEFCYAKEKNVPAEHKGEFGYGYVWTWTAIAAETKLVPCWRVGGKDAREAYHFMRDLKSRLSTRVEVTSDGHKPYLTAGEGAFGRMCTMPC